MNDMIPAFLLSIGAALVISFLGTLTPGPINLTILSMSLADKKKQAIYAALAASLVEVGQMMIAVGIHRFMTLGAEQNQWIRIGTIMFLFFMGILFLVRDRRTRKKNEQAIETVELPVKGGNDLTKGLLTGFFVAALNPQAIPFWLFVLGFVETIWNVTLPWSMGWLFIIFLCVTAGVGKFFALLVYRFVGNRLKQKKMEMGGRSDLIIGGILIALSLFQSFAFWK